MILVMSDSNHQYTSKTTTKEDQAKMVSIHILHAQCPVDAKILRSTFPLLASMSLGLYITTSVLLKCGLEQQKDHLPKRRKRLGTSQLFSLNIHIIFIKTIVKLTYHLIFQRKHELNAVNLTSAQSFPSFGEVVPLLLKSTLQRQ